MAKRPAKMKREASSLWLLTTMMTLGRSILVLGLLLFSERISWSLTGCYLLRNVDTTKTRQRRESASVESTVTSMRWTLTKIGKTMRKLQQICLGLMMTRKMTYVAEGNVNVNLMRKRLTCFLYDH